MTATSEQTMATDALRRLTGALSQPDLTASEATALRSQLMSLVARLHAGNSSRANSTRWDAIQGN